ncbi:MAG: Fe-S protein assembly co-chaperone HscB [Zoogloeaceae bacterium]|jgi:molecular chaperone HscB|nr:Fe-S protein assembly co-chaperone HscB [Zoogloeaceae bacterium]
MEPLEFNADFFTLFQLPRAFRLDLAELERRYREAQQAVHPDRFAAAGNEARRVSLQWAARVNEAWQTLKSPLARARYLLELAGQAIGTTSNPAMDSAFLMEQMEWREAAQEARVRRDPRALEHLRDRLAQTLEASFREVAVALDERGEYAVAAECVRRLMFQEKLARELDDALAALEDEEADA